MQKRFYRSWGFALLLLVGCSRPGGGIPHVIDKCSNLATVPHGKRAFARFTLVNPEAKPLLIKQIMVSCKCAYLELTAEGADGTRRLATGGVKDGVKGKLLLQPGEKAHAVFRYETGERPPLAITLEEPVTFFLAHPQVPRIDCRIKINISLPLRFTPPIPDFGTVIKEQAATLLLHLYPLKGKPPIKVLGIDFPGQTRGTKGNGKPVQAADMIRGEVIKSLPERVTIKFTAPTGLPSGPHGFPIRVRTDAGDNFVLPLILPVSIRPEMVIDPAPPLPLGSITVNRESSVSSTIKWYGAATDVTMRIRDGAKLPPGIEAKLVEKKPGRIWRIELSYKPGKGRPKPGIVRGAVCIVTTAPGHQEMTVKFKGRFQR